MGISKVWKFKKMSLKLKGFKWKLIFYWVKFDKFRGKSEKKNQHQILANVFQQKYKILENFFCRNFLREIFRFDM